METKKCVGRVARFLAGVVACVGLCLSDVQAEEAERSLLEPIMTVELGKVGPFVAKEKFRAGKTVDGLRVVRVGATFKQYFLAKVEKRAVAAETLVVYRLSVITHGADVTAALGGEEKVEITLGQFWEFLKTADQRYWYVAHVRDTKGTLRALGAGWEGDGLHIDARSVENSLDWFAGDRFLAR